MSKDPLRALRVLVVDDNANMRRIVRQVLNSFGCMNITDANDGAQALTILQASEVDIIIADYLMDPLDGLDMTRHVRTGSDSTNPYVPIILMTGMTNANLINQARDAGVTEVVAKPISADALYRRLFAIIERPRPFVRAKAYFGPDRRRRADAEYEGPKRRDDDDDDTQTIDTAGANTLTQGAA